MSERYAIAEGDVSTYCCYPSVSGIPIMESISKLEKSEIEEILSIIFSESRESDLEFHKKLQFKIEEKIQHLGARRMFLSGSGDVPVREDTRDENCEEQQQLQSIRNTTCSDISNVININQLQVFEQNYSLDSIGGDPNKNNGFCIKNPRIEKENLYKIFPNNNITIKTEVLDYNNEERNSENSPKIQISHVCSISENQLSSENAFEEFSNNHLQKNETDHVDENEFDFQNLSENAMRSNLSNDQQYEQENQFIQVPGNVPEHQCNGKFDHKEQIRSERSNLLTDATNLDYQNGKQLNAQNTLVETSPSFQFGNIVDYSLVKQEKTCNSDTKIVTKLKMQQKNNRNIKVYSCAVGQEQSTDQNDRQANAQTQISEESQGSNSGNINADSVGIQENSPNNSKENIRRNNTRIQNNETQKESRTYSYAMDEEEAIDSLQLDGGLSEIEAEVIVKTSNLNTENSLGYRVRHWNRYYKWCVIKEIIKVLPVTPKKLVKFRKYKKQKQARRTFCNIINNLQAINDIYSNNFPHEIKINKKDKLMKSPSIKKILSKPSNFSRNN